MGRLSRKTVAWAAGAALAVGGCTAGIVIAVQGAAVPARAPRHGPPRHGRPPRRARPSSGPCRCASSRSARPAGGRDGQRRGRHHRHLQPAAARHRAAADAVPCHRRVLAADRRRRGLHAGDGIPRGHARHGHGARAPEDSGARPESSSFKTGGLQHAAAAGDPRAARLPAADLDAGCRRGGAVDTASAAAQLSAAYAPPAGTFHWQRGYPSQLRSFWSQGKANTLDRGAITGFEADHGLATDGVAGTGRVEGAADGRRRRTSGTRTGTATRSPASGCRRR